MLGHHLDVVGSPDWKPLAAQALVGLVGVAIGVVAYTPPRPALLTTRRVFLSRHLLLLSKHTGRGDQVEKGHDKRERNHSRHAVHDTDSGVS